MTPTEQYLVNEEGYRQFPYRCTAGKLTIGIGFNLDDAGLSMDESLLILRHRIVKIRNAIRKKCAWYDSLAEARQACLVGMAYQMGIEGLFKFKATLAYAEAGRFEEAALNMLASKWARQTPARAQRAAYMMRYGKFPE